MTSFKCPAMRPLMWMPLAWALGLALSASAQTTALPPPVQAPADVRAPLSAEPRVERITHEDGLSRIDELRVGGQTRSIDVQPKNGAPAYQVAPQQAHESPGPRSGTAGKSSWRVLNF
jgi:hypothetical protein